MIEKHEMIIDGQNASCSCGGWWYMIVNSKIISKEEVDKFRKQSFQKHLNIVYK